MSLEFPNNIVQNVETYQHSELALLLNSFVSIHYANKKFQNFQTFTGNLGSSVTFDAPYRVTSANGLQAAWQGLEQRVFTLTVDQAINSSFEITDEQRIFNLNDQEFMRMLGASTVAEMGSKIESNVNLNYISGVVNNDENSANFGVTNTASGPYRFYGNGTSTPISSFQNLEQMMTNFEDFGCPTVGRCVILPMSVIPPIVGSGLNQFAIDRNNKLAMSWEIGEFGTPPIKFYKSNLLPIHNAGSVGNASGTGNILTVVSTNDPTGANITQITFSGASASDLNAVKKGDLFQFNDNVSGLPDLRFLTFVGHQPCQQPVQCRVTNDAAATGGGQVTLNIYPALSFQAGRNQNIQYNITAGMKVTVMPSHRAGIVISADALYVGMPQMPTTEPFPFANKADPDTGVSLRMYYGFLFGKGGKGLIHDQVWGSFLHPDYCMRILCPV